MSYLAYWRSSLIVQTNWLLPVFCICIKWKPLPQDGYNYIHVWEQRKSYLWDKNYEFLINMWGRQRATQLNMSKTFHIFASAWLSVTMEGVTQCCLVPPMDSPNLDRIALFPILSTADTIPTDARVHCLRRCETDSQRHCLASDLHHDFNFKPSCLVEILIGL